MIYSLAIALLAAKPDAAHPSWMIGSWGWQNAGETGVDCGSDHDTEYRRDGTYLFIDEVGTWRIEGNRLIETVTDPGESGIPTDRGKTNVIKFKRVRPGVLEVGGENPGRMIKCPAH